MITKCIFSSVRPYTLVLRQFLLTFSHGKTEILPSFDMKKKVLFLCAGNACRSQMEEWGIDLSSHTSDHVDKYLDRNFSTQ